MQQGRVLFEAALEQTSFDGGNASARIQDSISALTTQTSDLFWSSPQCKTLLLMRFIQLGLQTHNTSQVTSLCEALYLDNAISKQQLRRAIQRICANFYSLTAECPEASELLAIQISEFSVKNLLSSKFITLLPYDFARNCLAASSPIFCETFNRELTILANERSAYLDRVDSLLDPYIALFSRSSVLDTDKCPTETQDENLLKMRQHLRAFFTQDVILNKWASLNWLFVRRSVERALACDVIVSEPLLTELFD